MKIVISHRIFPNLALNCTKLVPFLLLKHQIKVSVFCLRMPQTVVKAIFEQRDGHGKSGNIHRKVMNKMFCKVCGNPGSSVEVKNNFHDCI